MLKSWVLLKKGESCAMELERVMPLGGVCRTDSPLLRQLLLVCYEDQPQEDLWLDGLAELPVRLWRLHGPCLGGCLLRFRDEQRALRALLVKLVEILQQYEHRCRLPKFPNCEEALVDLLHQVQAAFGESSADSATAPKRPLEKCLEYCLAKRSEKIDSLLTLWKNHSSAPSASSAAPLPTGSPMQIVVNGIAGRIKEVGEIECPDSWTVAEVRWEIAKRIGTAPHTFRLLFKEVTIGKGCDLGLDCPMSKVLEIAGPLKSSPLPLTLIKVPEKYNRYQAAQKEAEALQQELAFIKSGSPSVLSHYVSKIQLTKRDFVSRPLTEKDSLSLFWPTGSSRRFNHQLQAFRLQLQKRLNGELGTVRQPKLDLLDVALGKFVAKPQPTIHGSRLGKEVTQQRAAAASHRRNWKAHQVGRSQQRKL